MRIVGQLLVEGLVLSLVGGGIGVVLALYSYRAVSADAGKSWGAARRQRRGLTAGSSPEKAKAAGNVGLRVSQSSKDQITTTLVPTLTRS